MNQEAEMADQRFILSIKLKNLLSYSEHSAELELQPLNVLIGPNGSGKSNLIEAISLLQKAPRDLASAIRKGGGAQEWIWKGGSDSPAAEITAVVRNSSGLQPLRYRLSFAAVGQRFEIEDEAVENEKPSPGEADVYFYYRFQRGRPIINVLSIETDSPGAGSKQRHLQKQEIDFSQSILAQRRDPLQYPEITSLANEFDKIRLFREWNLGRDADPRRPQQADLPEDFLLESMSNLGLVLNDLTHRPGMRVQLLAHMRNFLPRIADITTKIHAGTVQLYIHEEGLSEPIPATRLSDGTLRYLCLLTILCHPSPPPLVCIEEPELGLHPDAIPALSQVLVDASRRTQLILTTHSDALVSALSDRPEAILVCEHDLMGTQIRRLDSIRLADWLKNYSLGDLWRMGEIGGTL